MLAGISTACLYPEVTERGFACLAKIGVQAAELFVNTFREVEAHYLLDLRKQAADCGIQIRSMHPFTSGLEPLLFFSDYERRFEDGLEFYKWYFHGMNQLGADIFVFHGDHRDAKTPPERYFDRFGQLMETAKHMGIVVAQENVPRCASGNPAFIARMRKALPHAKFVLDTKQALRSGCTIEEMAKAMGDGIVHLHVSDHDETHDCLPVGKGNLDVVGLLELLKGYGFDGAVILELYRNNYGSYEELEESYQKLYNMVTQLKK